MDYSDLYKNKSNAFGELPGHIVNKSLTFMEGKTVLDIGAGDGRNTIYLAQHGFQVTALDNCENGLSNISKKSGGQGNIVMTLSDITSFCYPKQYDNILCNFMLHHFDRDIGMGLIKNLRKNTSYGGLNIVSGFLNKGDMYTEKNQNRLWFESNELQRIYNDWEILHYEERDVELISGGIHQVGEIIVQKKINKGQEVSKIIGI